MEHNGPIPARRLYLPTLLVTGVAVWLSWRGLRLTFSSGLAYVVLIIEAAAVVLLSITGWLRLRQRA